MWQHQWRNRRGGRAWHFSTGNFLLTYREEGGKEESGKNGKWGRKEGKIWKGRGGKLKMVGEKVWKWAEDLFFFFFALRFLKPLKFVWGLPKWTILPGKIIFHAAKNLGKLTLPPLTNIPLTSLESTFLYFQCF